MKYERIIKRYHRVERLHVYSMPISRLSATFFFFLGFLGGHCILFDDHLHIESTPTGLQRHVTCDTTIFRILATPRQKHLHHRKKQLRDRDRVDQPALQVPRTLMLCRRERLGQLGLGLWEIRGSDMDADRWGRSEIQQYGLELEIRAKQGSSERAAMRFLRES